MSDSLSSLSAPKKSKKQRQFRFFFFALVRGFFFSSSSSRAKMIPKNFCCSSEEHIDKEAPKAEEDEEGEEREEKREVMGEGGGDVAVALQRSVKQLHFGSWEEKEAAAVEIRRIAREDGLLRKSLAALGVIPSLVSMLDSGNDRRRRLAIQALIELANGTYTNKALMVEAGILTKLPGLMDTRDQCRGREFLSLLHSISSLARTEFPVASCNVLPLLIEILDGNVVVDEAKLMCLGTLHNLSTKLGNTRAIVSSGAVRTLLRLAGEKVASERALATLGNLVVSMAGKKAIEDDEMVPKSLVEIMTWEDKPRCQELVVYILMVLAHSSTVQRQKMAESGLVPLLLEVALLGSPLAQKRALKTLQRFRDARQTKVAVHSGPQTGLMTPLSGGSPADYQRETKEYRKEDIKKMVKQSLRKNMESIMRRASASEDTSKLKALVVSSSSKSLPY